ncbi:immunity 52 family protein [Oxalobacteraceae bacterium]|nr:immunity 52 family protein [Oxalobacteraceae bacterium]
MNNPIEITVHFRTTGHLRANEILDELHTFSKVLAVVSLKLTGWLLKGKSKKEAFLYDVFDANGPTSAAAAVLTEKLKNDIDPRIVSMWNGHDDDGDGAAIKYIGRLPPEACLMTLNMESEAFTGDWKAAAELVTKAVLLWHASVVTVETSGYFDHRVFKDRPGVGWMLYLPKVLTVQQVPEARALIPVLGSDKKQVGTIIVSITDAPFSDQNPEHVKIANAIEVRLVDQDLLPRYADS